MSRRRFRATVTHQVEADRTHIFVLTGDIEAPTVTLWNGDVRTWDGSETTFEARFGHTMQSLGPIDVHFNPVGEVPAVGQQAATLEFGEIAPAALFEAGDYVIDCTIDICRILQTTRNDQWRSGLVDQDGVHLIHNRKIHPTLHLLVQ